MAHPLQLMFVKRLKEEMESRQLSANGLAKAAKQLGFRLGQRSVSRILELKQDPTLQKVLEISQTLDVPVKALISDSSQDIKKPLQNVVQMQAPYPKIFVKKSHPTKNGVTKWHKTHGKK